MEINNKDSKYRKNKDSKGSKYIKTADQRREEKANRKTHTKAESAKDRYNAYLEEEEKRKAEQLAAVQENEENAQTEERHRSKGSNTALFSQSRKTEPSSQIQNPHYAEFEREPTKRDYDKAQTRRIIISVLLVIPTILLQLARFHVPLTPGIITIDFSALFELLSAIAFGPITGVAITVAKNILYVIINNNALPTAVSNTIADSAFVIIASMLYTKGMFSPKAIEKREIKYMKNQKTKDGRGARILYSSLIASLAAGIIFPYAMNYVTFPIIYKMYSRVGYTSEYVLESYNYALTRVHHYFPFVENIVHGFSSTLQGVYFYNLPLAIFKYLVCAVVVAIIYKPLSPLLHSRNI